MFECVMTIQHVQELKRQLAPFFNQDFHQLPPFGEVQLHFCHALRQALLQIEENRRFPDLMALAFWLRQGHLQQMHKHLHARAATMLVPRGLVFHFPPANLNVMLVYSWVISLLAGNGNIIRLPSRPNVISQKLLQIIQQILSEEQFSLIRETTCFIQYGHEESFTAWISAHVDARIIWGGNATVEKLRKIPLKPHAKDIAFPDRFSFALIGAQSYLGTNASQRQQLADYFFNDAYLFDQSACSSPRLIFWLGNEETITTASRQFYTYLQASIVQAAYEVSLAGVLAKQTYMYNQALNLPVEAAYTFSNELTILTLPKALAGCREHCGQGLFFHVAIESMQEIIPFVTAHDQTLVYYGCSLASLHQLAVQLNGRGLTRMVPMGQALHFEPLWDGQDLLLDLTCQISIKGCAAQ